MTVSRGMAQGEAADPAGLAIIAVLGGAFVICMYAMGHEVTKDLPRTVGYAHVIGTTLAFFGLFAYSHGDNSLSSVLFKQLWDTTQPSFWLIWGGVALSVLVHLGVAVFYTHATWTVHRIEAMRLEETPDPGPATATA